METKKIISAIEAILFASGEPVKTLKLAQLLNVGQAVIKDAASLLKNEYDVQARGIGIIEIDEGYQLTTSSEFYPYVKELFGERKRQAISNAAMETLTIIAYKQPVTKTMIEHIRGVNSDGAVNRLLEKGLIEECGRLDAPGKPYLYATTCDFLRCFGLKTLKDLPEIDFKRLSNDIEYEQIAIEG